MPTLHISYQRKNTPHIPHALFPYPGPLTITVYHPFRFPYNRFPHRITTASTAQTHPLRPPTPTLPKSPPAQTQDFDPASRERRKPDRDRRTGHEHGALVYELLGGGSNKCKIGGERRNKRHYLPQWIISLTLCMILLKSQLSSRVGTG